MGFNSGFKGLSMIYHPQSFLLQAILNLIYCVTFGVSVKVIVVY